MSGPETHKGILGSVKRVTHFMGVYYDYGNSRVQTLMAIFVNTAGSFDYIVV